MFLFELVQYIERNGIELRIIDGRLRVTGDQSKLTPEIAETMRRFKPALQAYCERSGSGIERATTDDGSFPLSLAQQRLYFLYQYDPTVTSFILPTELELRGRLDVARLGRAIGAVVDRHDIYRAVYSVESGLPRQRVDRSRVFAMDVLDVSELEAGARACDISLKRDAVATTPFDLGVELPLRACLVRESDDLHRLIVAIHHIATDDWSIQQFVAEVAAAYRDDGVAETAPPRLSYLDYAAWQNAVHDAGGYEVSRSYWQAHLEGIRGVLELPLDKPRPPVQTFGGATVTRRIAPEISQAAAAAARRLGSSEFSLYLGIFNVLISKLSGERDIVVGTDVYGRDHADLQDVPGFFVNQVALRSQIDPQESIGEYLARLGAGTMESLQYQDMPFDKLVDALGFERDTAFSPVFQVKFLYDRTPHRIELFDDIEVREGHAFQVRSQYDVTLKVVGDEAVFYYNTDLFHAGTVEQWADLYMAMLARAIETPQAAVAGLLHDALAERLAGNIQGECRDVDASALFDGFDRAVRETPESIAVRTADGAASYAELDARIAQIGGRLLAMGVRKGDKVAIHLERSIDLVASIVAVLRIGAVFVPIDPSYPREHIEYTLEDSEAGIVISDSLLSEGLSDFYGFVLDLDQLAPEPGAQAPAWASISADDIAYLLYTSGSTGRPKGALVGHGALSNLCDWYIRFAGLDARSRVLLMIPIGFDASIKNVICPLMVGGTVVLARAGAFDPDLLLEQIEDVGVTLINCAPSAMNAIMKVDAPGDYARLASLEMLALGGEALDIGVFASWLSSRWCRATLANIYGPTECTDISVAWKADRETWLAQAVAPIGHPIQNARACIVDADLQLCPLGVAGELLIAGRGVGAGYHNLEEATARSFIESAVAGGRAYRTGDICRYDSLGRIVYVGRRDGQIKVRGKRVEISEIVARLAQCLPSRKISVQLYSEHGLEMLLAFVDGGTAGRSSDEVRSELAKLLPRHMVPAQILFVDALPLTPNGKVDARALIAQFEAQRGAGEVDDEPLDEVEEVVAAVWRELLGVDALGRSSDFFALGGDSIFSIQLVAMLRDRGIPVAVADIFRHPTIGQLAALVREAGRSGDAPHPLSGADTHVAPFALVPEADRPLLPDGLEDAYPVTALQHGMIFHGIYDEEASAYHDVFSFELTFDYEEAAFIEALQHAVDEHPVLRTGFALGGYTVPLQFVHADVTANVERLDLRDHGPEEQESLISAHIRRLKDQGFDLQARTLIRFSILRRAERCIQLVIDAHHAILDGWSMATLQRQVFDSYRRIKDGQAPDHRFSPGRARFADYVARVLEEEVDPGSRAYWSEYARRDGAGAISRVWPVPQAIETLEIRLDPGLARSIDAIVAREGIPVKTLMLMAHAYMLACLTGRSRMFTGNADNGRLEAAGAENVMGLFLNALPYHLDLADTSWRDLGRTLLDDEGARKPHRRYPFATILRENPGLQIDSLFTYTNFRVSRDLVHGGDLEVKVGELFEELSFKVSTHVSGNGEDGYSLLLRTKIHLSQDGLALLLRRYVGALEAMVEDFAGPVPAPAGHRVPALASGRDGIRICHADIRHVGALDLDALIESSRQIACMLADGGMPQAESVSVMAVAALARDEDTVGEALSRLAASDALFRVAIVEGDDGGGQRLILRGPDRHATERLVNRYLELRGGDHRLRVRAEAGGEWLDACRVDADADFWSRYLDGLAPVLQVASGAPVPAAAGRARVALALPEQTLRGLADLASTHGVDTMDVAAVAWIALLSRLGEQSEIAVGMVGPSGLVQPLRCDTGTPHAVATALAALAESRACVSGHALLPVSALAGLVDDGCLHTVVAGERLDAMDDVALALIAPEAGAWAVEYAASRFDAATVDRFASYLRQLVEGMLAAPARPLSSLPILPAEERGQVLGGFQSPRPDWSHDRTAHALFEARARTHPDAEAVRHDGVSLSYAELDARANRLAHRLIALGVGPDD
ncbi:non-ribosomal peptide synthetase, partial [Marilutibacter chinensis]